MRTTLLIIFLSVRLLSAQTDQREELDEIIVKGNFAETVNPGYSIQVISDSILKSDYQSLGELLQNQVNLYFKQNGYGMVSSISLRGTTAAQTGVFWNGLNINSALNGQTDFNTLQGNSFSEIEIRRGGGSVLLGNGAVGGAINLSDRIHFDGVEKLSLLLGAGSYQTYNGQFTGLLSTNDFFAKVSFGGFSSKNDYPFLGTDLKNDNGEIRNYNVNVTLAYKLNDKNQINLFSTVFDNDRNLSRTLTTTANENLTNLDTRLMSEWKYLGNHFTSSLKLAFLHEDFKYLFDQDQPDNSSEGSSDRLIAKYDLTYFLKENIFLKGGVEFENAKGNGSNFEDAVRNDFTGYLLFQHSPTEKLTYNLSSRAGSSSAYDIPVIFSVDGSYRFNQEIMLRAAFSSNYRLPTFNDLYWVPGGNPELNPEKSYSGELGFDFSKKKNVFSVSGFFIRSEDLIQWQPGIGGIWSPVNVKSANNYGIESSLTGRVDFRDSHFDWTLQYDYTQAIDEDLDTQLIYVPQHKANALLSYQIKSWRFGYQFQYVGEVYTTTSNTQSLDPYSLSNLEMIKGFWEGRIFLKLRVNNLFDTAYESVAYRPMPNRNFLINMTFKL